LVFELRSERKNLEIELLDLKNMKTEDLSIATYQANVSFAEIEKDLFAMRKEKVKLEDDILGLKDDVGNLEEDRDLLESEKFEIQADIDELNQLMADARQSPVKLP
jgi:predicted  nucleic acid-binding Zn-ribbon protein